MKTINLILFNCFITLSFAFAGDRVGNGGGLSENNIIFAYQNLSAYIKFAKSTPSIQFDSVEQSILNEIEKSLEKEYQNPNQLRFSSGRQYPRRFFKDGKVRFMVTYNSVGSTIHINTDMLYTPVNNQIRFVSINEAISMLIHELGHHHRIKNHQLLNELGAKVATPLYQSITKVISSPRTKNVFANIIKVNSGNAIGFDQIMLNDGEKYFDIREYELEKLTCRNGAELKGMEFYQSRWKRTNRASLYFTTDIIAYCQVNAKLEIHSLGELNIYPLYIYREGKTLIEQIQVEHVPCQLSRNNCYETDQLINRLINQKTKYQNFIGGNYEN